MHWYSSRFFRYSIGIILVLCIILLVHQTEFLFKPILDFIAALFFPILLASILYYILRPLVRLLEKGRVPRSVAILLVYCLVIIFIGIVSSQVVPILMEQIGVLTSTPSKNIELVKEKTADIIQFFNINFISLAQIKELATTYLYKINELISENIVAAVATTTRFAVWLLITPFILYYFLKDDHAIYRLLIWPVPQDYKPEAQQVAKEIDSTLSTFITGQLLVAVSLSFLLFIGYVAIGLDNAFILAVFAMICFTIPFFGTFIALIPATLVALSQGPWMALKVLIVMAIAQVIESNFVSPQIMAQRLKIHPLALMLILLASGSLYGVLGLFLATPIYAVARVLGHHALNFYNNKNI